VIILGVHGLVDSTAEAMKVGLFEAAVTSALWLIARELRYRIEKHNLKAPNAVNEC